MSFVHPVVAVLALLAGAAAAFCVHSLRARRNTQALAYSNVAFLEDALRASPWPERILTAGVAFATFFIVAATGGPRLAVPLPARDASAILCIDTSGSMAAQDVAPTRSDASKEAARRFIGAAPAGMKIGIVSFATAASVVQPPTADKDAATQAVDRVPDPNGATAIGDALALAARLLPDHGHRAVIVITDGVNNRGVDPLEVAKFLASRHVPVYTVGIGTNDSGQVIPGTSEPATIDEDALRALAQTGGGTYARADSAQALQNALAQLGRTTVIERKKIDASLPFAVAGAALLLVLGLAAMAAGKFP